MTQKETLAAIRALRLAVRYSPDWGEWRVTLTRDEEPSAERREAIAIYTPDADDALGGAKRLRFWRDEHQCHIGS